MNSCSGQTDTVGVSATVRDKSHMHIKQNRRVGVNTSDSSRTIRSKDEVLATARRGFPATCALDRLWFSPERHSSEHLSSEQLATDLPAQERRIST